MLEAAEKVCQFTEGHTLATLHDDDRTVLAVIKCIEIIGEAAAGVTEQTRKSHPQTPWPLIIGMRNRLVRVYFDVDLVTLWSTVQNDLPPLIAQLHAMLAGETQ